MRDDSELHDASNPARQLVEMLGHSVEHAPEGRVDLLACSLLKSREGREVFDAIERETKCNFAASDNKTGNPKTAAIGSWRATMLTFEICIFWDKFV